MPDIVHAVMMRNWAMVGPSPHSHGRDMTTTHWRNAITGDFAKAGKWDDGVPGIQDDAVIPATGADYTVKVISADAAHALTLDSTDATLLEKAQGSLHVGTL